MPNPTPDATPSSAPDGAQLAYTRRSALAAGVAAAGIAGTGLVAGPAAAGQARNMAGALPLVRPMSAQRVQQNWGICDHPDFTAGYQNRAAVLDRIAGMRIACIRGMFTHDSRGDATAARLRANDMGWVMTVYPTEHGMTTARLVARIRYLGEHAADLCRAIEGPNSGTTPAPAAHR